MPKIDTAEVVAEMTARIRETIAPEKTVLFGSRARGEARTSSDFDLLIIAPSTLPRWQRTPSLYRLLAGLGVPKDIVWWTPEEVAEWRGVRSHFINTVLKSPREHALGLLAKAEHDLVAARATPSTGRAMDMVCFHARQATEKSLKALLALHDAEYPWRHDLGELVELARPFASEVVALEERVIQLSPFAVEARYDDELAPSLSEAIEALQTATEIYDLIVQVVQRDKSVDVA